MKDKREELKAYEALQELLEANIIGLQKELEQEEKEEEQEKYKFPQDSDAFYFIDENGSVFTKLFEENYIEDSRKKMIGNCFRTKADADFAVERLKVIKELKEFSRPFDSTQDNYYLEWHVYGERSFVCTPWSSYEKTNNIYFESKVKAKEAIKAIGEDRIKKYYFGLK